jgi:hypothetical protein
MVKRYKGGLMSSTEAVTSISDSRSIWNLTQATQARNVGNWPGLLSTETPGSGSGAGFANNFMTVSNVSVTDSNYTVLNDTPYISTSGGYLKITGRGFVSGCVVYIGGTAATTTTFIDSTEVRAVVPATTSNTLMVYVVNPDGSTGIKLSALTFSGTPTWSTSETLSNQATDLPFSIQFSATSDSAVTYALNTGSTLPPGTALYANGLFTGTVTGVTSDTTYSFSVVANDAENQDTARTFSITLSAGEAYFYTTSLLLNGDANVWIRDSSVNNFLPNIGGDTRPTAFSPYNTNWSGYFDGSGDYLNITGSTSNLAFGSNDWTIEFFMFLNSTVQSIAYSGNPSGVTSGAYPTIYASNGTTNISYVANGGTRIVSDAAVVIGRWYHVVVSRVSGVTRMFIDGTVQTQTYTDSTVYLNGTDRPTIAAQGHNNGVELVNGYISNMRVLNGTGYTSVTVPTSPLTAITNTQLLILQNNRFIDNSTNAYIISRNGDTATKSFGPFAESDTTTGSAYFDGSGDNIVVADNAVLELGSGAFCVECWFYTTTVSSNGVIIDKRSGSYGPILIWRSTTSIIVYMSSAGTSWDMVSTVTIPGTIAINTWYHLAVYRTGTTIYGALNGNVAILTGTNSSTPQNNAGNIYIGAGNNGADYFTGYINDFRIVVGSGVYTSANFTPTTSSLTSVANTQLLTLQYRQGENNSRFVDQSGLKAVVTRVGNATQGSFTPFSPAGWSGYFDGTGDYLTFPANADFAFSTGDFTVEAWIYLTANQAINAAIIANFDNPNGWFLSFATSPANNTVVWSNYNTIFLTSSSAVPLNTWTHVAVARAGTALAMYFNGVSVASATNSTNIGVAAGTGYIGFNNGVAYFTGYMSNARVVKGLAVYTGAFTPPTTILGNTQSSGTNISAITAGSALLTLQDNRFKDNGKNALAITKFGDAKIQNFSPFRPTTGYTPATHGGSAYFDGTGDYITMPVNTPHDLTQGNFTIEAWVYRNVAGALHNIYSNRGAASQDGLEFRINADNTLSVFYTGPGNTVSSTLTLTAGQWYHVAAVRIGSTAYLYINGLQAGSASIGNGTTGTATTKIGADNALTSNFNGYISGLRVIKGQGIFTGNFTVPTAPPGLTQTLSTNVAAMSGNVTLLTNFTNGGIVDVTSRSVFETTGNVTVSNVQSKFGVGSISFPGALTSYLKTPTNPILDFGTGDFTVEFWVYFNSVAADQGFFGGSTTNAWEIRWRTSTGLNLGRLNTAFDSTFAWSPSTATWYHVAVRRSGTSVNGYINGSQIGTTSTNSNTYNSGTLFYIGITDTSNNPLNGYMDDIRITKGFARTISLPTSAALTK